jgi:hypothetical protein
MRYVVRCPVGRELMIQDEEIDVIYTQLESEFGEVTYEAWLALLVS